MRGGVLNNEFGFLSSYVKWTDGSVCLMNRQDAAVKDWIADYQYLKDGLLRVSRATFVSLLFRRDVVIEEGLPIKEFFIWGDDTEYTLRIAKRHKCYFVSDSVVVHKMKANMNTTLDIFIKEDSDRLDRYFYRERNLFYIRKKQGKKELLKYLANFMGMSLALLFKCKTRKLKKLKIIWKGLLAGICFNPSIEYITGLQEKGKGETL